MLKIKTGNFLYTFVKPTFASIFEKQSPVINLRPKHFTILFAVFLSISLSAQGHNHDHDHDHDHNHQHQETGHEGHNHSDHQGHNHSDHDGHNHNDHQGHNHSDHEGHGHDEHHANACGMSAHHGEFNPGDLAFHHVSDQNVYNIGPLQIPLPCIMWVPKQGFDFFSSGKFNADSHGNGTKVYKKYVCLLYTSPSPRDRG